MIKVSLKVSVNTLLNFLKQSIGFNCFFQETLVDQAVNYTPKHDTKKGDEMGKNMHNRNCNQEDQDSKS